MYNNFKMKFKGLELKRLFWKAASTYNIKEHKRTMKEILKCNPKVNENKNAFEWLSDIPEHQWARSYFPTRTKCDVLVYNISESFNHCIMAARDLPIIEMFEWIRSKSMTRIQIKREGMEKYDGSICPNIVKKIEVQRKESRNCFPSWVGEDKFEIKHWQSNHVVHLKSKSCTCGMFQLVGYLCCHAIAALDMHRQDLLEFVDVYFSKQMYLYLYNHIISPVPGMHDFEKASLGIAYPPIIKKRIGSPKKAQRPDANDIKDSSKATRKGLTRTCAICHEQGHNKISCKKTPHPNSRFAKGQGELSVDVDGPARPEQTTTCDGHARRASILSTKIIYCYK
ncbi:uncharacterized protein LOC127252521 [Andrographis paniculata]|uniref:uncharacterized protein LOC127252521 n=1 Tax=Andrographis paniculata TaxID=175694 RepID=UPI0021E74ABB|nr:uncharacterized protein LOC127252521 [Andrographis paniculata]XP_051132672.1 uncharacterized protein LOC127252521 [Andrographis paniculata]